MTTDPFIAQRIGEANNGNFGVDGTSIYVSFPSLGNFTTRSWCMPPWKCIAARRTRS